MTYPPAQDPYRDPTRPLDPYGQPPTAAHPAPPPAAAYPVSPAAPDNALQPYVAPPGPYPPVSGMPHPPTSASPYPPYMPQMVVHQGPPPASGLAVASMVLSIIGLVSGCCTFGIPALLAVILGHVALSETRSGAKSGHGMAIAGLVMGYILVAPALLFSAWVIFFGGMAALAG